MTNAVGGAAYSTAADTSQNAAQPKADVTKDQFLQLLVAQIKNQDPLNPTDGVQFLTQLAQFSELEQLVGMRNELQTLSAEMKPTDTKTNGGTENV